MPKRNELHDVFKQYDLTGGLNDNKIHNELCWPFRVDKYSLNGKGQPLFSYRGKQYYSYRIIYHVTHPNEFLLDDPRVIRHVVCDNNLCGNYAHMAPGSQKQNVQDAVDHHRFGLTKEEKDAIIDLSEAKDALGNPINLTHERIAQRVTYQFKRNIARSTVTDLISGRRDARRKGLKDGQ